MLLVLHLAVTQQLLMVNIRTRLYQLVGLVPEEVDHVVFADLKVYCDDVKLGFGVTHFDDALSRLLADAADILPDDSPLLRHHHRTTDRNRLVRYLEHLQVLGVGFDELRNDKSLFSLRLNAVFLNHF